MMMPSSSMILCLIFIAFSAYTASSQIAPPPLYSVGSYAVYPIYKDLAKTQLYYTSLQIGSPIKRSVDFTLTLDDDNLWYTCKHDDYNSTSYRPVKQNSDLCDELGNKALGSMSCNAPPRPGCSNGTCVARALNPFSGKARDSFFGTEIVRVPLSNKAKLETVRVPLTCTDYVPGDLTNFPQSTRGILGLGVSGMAFPQRLSSPLGLDDVFGLCLPSGNMTGKFYVGPENRKLAPDMKKTQIATDEDGFFIRRPSFNIGVESIDIAGEPVRLNSSLLTMDSWGTGGTRLSIVNPDTVLHSAIYKPVVHGYVNAATRLKMKRVAGAGRLQVCFDADSVNKDRYGYVVPTIDLGLQNNVKWRIFGSNLMVEVSKRVVCLGIVDGGLMPSQAAIQIGGKVLEDHLLELNGSGFLAFSSSLARQNMSCSDLL